MYTFDDEKKPSISVEKKPRRPNMYIFGDDPVEEPAMEYSDSKRDWARKELTKRKYNQPRYADEKEKLEGIVNTHQPIAEMAKQHGPIFTVVGPIVAKVDQVILMLGDDLPRGCKICCYPIRICCFLGWWSVYLLFFLWAWIIVYPKPIFCTVKWFLMQSMGGTDYLGVKIFFQNVALGLRQEESNYQCQVAY